MTVQDRRRLKGFGEALARAMTVRGMTHRELGEELGGVTQSAISAWKAGAAEPAPRTVFAIEQALALPPGHLARHLGYLPVDGSPPPPSSFQEIVLGDPLLDDLQKQAFLALYHVFVDRGRRPAKRRSAAERRDRP